MRRTWNNVFDVDDIDILYYIYLDFVVFIYRFIVDFIICYLKEF